MTIFASASRLERLLMVLTPAAAMAAVALGLRLGAPESVRAAVVFGAPPAAARAGLAWSVAVFDEDHGAREPAPGVSIDVEARVGDRSTTAWHGVTSADGVVEAWLDRAPADGESVSLEVRSGAQVLARGQATLPAGASVAPASAGWLRFARREGAIALDVALLGQRAAPGFPAELWVRASDAATHAPAAFVGLALESDPSLALTGAAIAPTDTRGWTHAVVIPAGLAVTATLDARGASGARVGRARTGTWNGGLYMAPGAPLLSTRARWEPGEPVALEVTMPTVRPAAYVAIDDARGRAWADAVPLEARSDGTSHAAVVARALAPGLYWAVASADAGGVGPDEDTRAWPAATLARPFFVASTDDAALAFGTEPATCVAPDDPRETASAVGACLALSVPVLPVRWLALDGFAAQRALDRDARTRGLAVALGALAVAILLEGVLLVRAARRAALPGPSGPRDAAHGRLTVAVAVLVALLGLALLAAFIVRV